MTKIFAIEQNYWWEVKSYLESPSKEALIDLLEQVYEDGYNEGLVEGGEDE